jgi:glycosyltransferase involved in cell wall biosynthesis
MDTVMNILMVTPRFLPEMGGIETHVYEVSRRLVAMGHAVTVLTTDRSGHLLPTEQMQGVQVHRVSAWPKQRDYYVAPAIYNRVRASAADVMHVQGYHTFVPPLAMATALRRQMPYVVTFHSGGHSSPLRNLVRVPQHHLLAPLIRRAAQCIGVSQFEAEFFRQRMKLRQCAVVSNGAQMPSVSGVALNPAPLIVSIGRLERYKGHHRILDAFPTILETLPHARLRILGEGPYEMELTRRAARLRLQERVEIGGIPPTDRVGVATVLARAALVVLLSDYEAHPVAVMEALTLGRRVLVTDGSGFREMVDHDAVEAIPLQATPRQIATAALSQLAKGPMRRPMALPSWEDCAERLAVIYQSVLHYRMLPSSRSRSCLGSDFGDQNE